MSSSGITANSNAPDEELSPLKLVNGTGPLDVGVVQFAIPDAEATPPTAFPLWACDHNVFAIYSLSLFIRPNLVSR